MKTMPYTLLQSYAYDNVLVKKYFCATTNFWRTYVRTREQWFYKPWLYCSHSPHFSLEIIFISGWLQVQK